MDDLMYLKSGTDIRGTAIEKDGKAVDLTDSRIESARVLFAMGMTESVPRASADTAIVSDKEIARLAEVKAMMEPTVAEVNLRARESVCFNLCAFTDTLHLSYPLAADGSEPA
jgi:ATP-dependent helicase/DNAse subunit B